MDTDDSSSPAPLSGAARWRQPSPDVLAGGRVSLLVSRYERWSCGGGDGDSERSPSPPQDLAASPGASPAPAACDEEDLRTRRDAGALLVAREMVASEETFVGDLHLLVVDFRAYLLDNSRWTMLPISSEELDALLGHLPQLLKLHERLLAEMKLCLRGGDGGEEEEKPPKALARVIVRTGPFLKLHALYAAEFENLCRQWDALVRRRPAFAAALREYETLGRCRMLALRHFLLRPVQRLLQYTLLLDSYRKHLEEGTEEFQDTEVALRVVRDVCQHVNHSKHLNESFERLWTLKSRFPQVQIIRPGRETLIKEGGLMKLCRKGLQARYFLLFNDCLLQLSYVAPYRYPIWSAMRLKCELRLEKMFIQLPEDSEDHAREFSVISDVRSFTLSACSVEERDRWVADLRAAIAAHTDRLASVSGSSAGDPGGGGGAAGGAPFVLGEKAPVWIPDDRVTMCHLCARKFTFTRRRHHCRACGKVVCASCSSHRASLGYSQCPHNRVCVACFAALCRMEEEGDCSKETLPPSDGGRAASGQKSGRSFADVGPRAVASLTPALAVGECGRGGTSQQMNGHLLLRHHSAWRRVWFSLRDGFLEWFDACEDVLPVGSLPLEHCKVFLHESEERSAIHLVCSNIRRLTLSSNSKSVVERWFSALQAATTSPSPPDDVDSRT